MLDSSKSLNIIYIAGSGRSGSTVLGDLIGSLDNAMHVGELRGVFDYTIHSANIMPCSCGLGFRECDFWNPIFENLFGCNWVNLFHKYKVEGNLPRIRELQASYKKPVDSTFTEIQGTITKAVEVLQAVQQKYELSAIVDSSKSIPFVTLLNQQLLLNVIVLHLVRDPRANLFSWLNRPIPMPNDDGSMSTRVRQENEAILSWMKENLAAQRLKSLGIPYLRVKYEDLVSNPYQQIKEIIVFCKQNDIDLVLSEGQESLLRNKQYLLEKRHLIGSNPDVKKKGGMVTLKVDSKWNDEIGSLQRIKWTLLFLPWLHRYKYPLWKEKGDLKE